MSFNCIIYYYLYFTDHSRLHCKVARYTAGHLHVHCHQLHASLILYFDVATKTTGTKYLHHTALFTVNVSKFRLSFSFSFC